MRAYARFAVLATLLTVCSAGAAKAEVKPPPPSKDRNCQTTVPFAR